MFSIYFYLFNIKQLSFNAEEAVENFTSFVSEVVCSTLEEDRESCIILDELAKKYSNFKVIKTNQSLKSNRFDGELKTIALQNCSKELRIIADADERFVLSQKELWERYGKWLLDQPNIDGLMVPVLDLWGERTKIRKNHLIGQKFRLHKDTVKERGVIKQAEYGNGLFNTKISDSTEPKLVNGDLANFSYITRNLKAEEASELNKYNNIFVIHEGYLNFNRRELTNRWWKPHWEARSGKEENVITDLKQLESEEVIEHGLCLV